MHVPYLPRFPMAKGRWTIRRTFNSLFLCCCGAIVFLMGYEFHTTLAASAARIAGLLKESTPTKVLPCINGTEVRSSGPPEGCSPKKVLPATSETGVRISGPLTGSTPPKVLPVINESDENWTSCPTVNELRLQSHFRRWDERLAKALSRSPLGAPKTERESWHAVTDNIHAFTAFLTSTPNRVVRITSLVRSRESDANRTKIQHPPLVCVIRTPNGTVRRKARIRKVWTYWSPDFKNALIVCRPKIRKGAEAGNMQVALAVRGSAADSLRWLELHRVPERAESKCCAVCVRPTYGSSMSLWKIVEFIVHYKIMGVTNFYFYDLDMSLDMTLLLTWLQYNSVHITIVPFKLIAKHAQVHAQGQMPALYDCIFRSMAKTEYYIHVDFDELIIPRKYSSISDILGKMERKRKGLGSVLIPARYFCSEYPISMKYSNVDQVPLQTRLFTYHFEERIGRGFSKYIARSRTVSEAGVHIVRTHRKGYRMEPAQSSLVFINHYRRCCDFLPGSAVVANNLNLKIFRGVPYNYYFEALAARIENHWLVRALKKLMNYGGSSPL